MKFSIALLAAGLASASATTLSADNWDSLTEGKTIFVKFFAPWCGHCKKLKPDWDKLMTAFEGHASALVGDCDCTGDCKPMCDANAVQGFPTLKFGSPEALEAYEGGRTFAELKKFSDENLKPVCSPANIDLCDEEKTAEIKKYQAMSAEELENTINAGVSAIEAAEAAFKEGVKGLQSQYEAMKEAQDVAVSEVKNGGLGMMKAVKAFAAKGGAKAEL